MKKFWIRLTALAVLVAALFAALFVVVCLHFPHVYENSYQKGFVYQYRALQNADPTQSKVIVIGGSNMTFGVDSAQLAEQLEMPVYTLGVHMGMGMDYIIETAEEFLNPGDVLVFSFWPYVSGEYGMDLIYLSLDNEYDMLWDFFTKHPWLVLQSAGTAVYNKLYHPLEEMLNRRIHPEAAGDVYHAQSFDPQTGNLIYKRDTCLLSDSALYENGQATREELSAGCIQEVTALAEDCRGRGVRFFMIYGPFFAKAYHFSSAADFTAYQTYLEQALQTEFIVDLQQCAMPNTYWYNGAGHLNDTGKRYYTDLLATGLRARLS